VEVSHVRNRLRSAIDTARARALTRRQQTTDAERAFESFLVRATAVLRQLTGALRAEGLAFTLSTPERALRLASDRSRLDFIELTLAASAEPPAVVVRISQTRGSRTHDEERTLKEGASIDEISEEDVLEFFLEALAPWLER
jgi:hypothetical protein